eukprot:1606816-Rhodomonas_salina.1
MPRSAFRASRKWKGSRIARLSIQCGRELEQSRALNSTDEMKKEDYSEKECGERRKGGNARSLVRRHRGEQDGEYPSHVRCAWAARPPPSSHAMMQLPPATDGPLSHSGGGPGRRMRKQWVIRALIVVVSTPFGTKGGDDDTLKAEVGTEENEAAGAARTAKATRDAAIQGDEGMI